MISESPEQASNYRYTIGNTMPVATTLILAFSLKGRRKIWS